MPRATRQASFKNMAEVLAHLGGISPARVRLAPAIGRATEEDLVRYNDRKERLYELVDGILVEKVMGFPESQVANRLSHLLQGYLDRKDLGFLTGEGGGIRLMPGLVRLPDLAFIRWDKLPAREVPMNAIGAVPPDLAVEVISPGNTKAEMRRKLREYLLAGTRLVWFVDPRRRTVTVHAAPDQSEVRTEGQTLDGGDVLPGLALPVSDVFARLSKIEGRGATKGRKAAQGEPGRGKKG
jgi:Uma2 family endonuclease